MVLFYQIGFSDFINPMVLSSNKSELSGIESYFSTTKNEAINPIDHEEFKNRSLDTPGSNLKALYNKNMQGQKMSSFNQKNKSWYLEDILL